jgi:hypothetical protein
MMLLPAIELASDAFDSIHVTARLMHTSGKRSTVLTPKPGDGAGVGWPRNHGWPNLSQASAGARHRVTVAAGVPAPMAFSTSFASLRIPNAATTSITPRTTSQMPTTRAKVTIESNG